MAELKEAVKTPEVKKTEKERSMRPATWIEPWGGLPSMRWFTDEMDRLFESVFPDLGMTWPGRRRPGLIRRMLGRPLKAVEEEPWVPRIEMLEREGQVVIKAELPGLTKEDVKVEVTDDLVTIQGERKEEKKEENEGYYFNECRYGSFFRSIPLPEGADPSKATAEFRNGVLEVVMPGPKRVEKKARGIEIKGG